MSRDDAPGAPTPEVRCPAVAHSRTVTARLLGLAIALAAAPARADDAPPPPDAPSPTAPDPPSPPAPDTPPPPEAEPDPVPGPDPVPDPDPVPEPDPDPDPATDAAPDPDPAPDPAPAAAPDPDATPSAADLAGLEVIELEGRAPLVAEPPRHTLDADQLRTLPASGNDPLRAVSSLPGVARVPFGLGGLALRGAAPRASSVFLDGIEVPLLYHFGGLASFVPVGVIADVTLEPSGFGARWGRATGGVVIATTRSPRADRWRTAGELSLLHAAALGEGPGPRGGSLLVAVRRSYVDAILAAAPVDLTLAPRYLDGQVRWESADRRWLVLGLVSDDRLRLLRDPGESSAGGIDTTHVRSLDYGSRFARLAARRRGRVGEAAYALLPWLGADQVVAAANHRGVDKGMTRWNLAAGLRAELERPLAGGTFAAGLDAQLTRHAYTLDTTPPPSPEDPDPPVGVVHRAGAHWAPDTGLWLEQRWSLADDRVAIRPGLRLDRFGLSGELTLGPRLTVTEELPRDLLLSQSLGLYHQPPSATDLDPVFGNRTLEGSWAAQAAVGAAAPLGDLARLQVTIYGQEMRDLPVDVVTGATPVADNGSGQAGGLLAVSRELVDEQFGSYSYREAVGRGRAWGVEVQLRRELGRTTGWLSYVWSRSLRTGDPRRDPASYPYVLDQPHVATLLVTRPLGRWRLGGRLRVASGNPITPVADAYFDPARDEWVAISGPILSERLPTFVQLDVRVDRTWRRRWGTIALFLDVQNATHRANPEGVTYNEDFSQRRYTRGLPIFPALGVEYLPPD